MNITEEYEAGIEKLKRYMEVVNDIPNEKQWNKYATLEKILTSKSLQYMYGCSFNVMCRQIIKEVRYAKKSKKEKK